MLKIRDFARLAEVSMTTLRYYDEIGLLKPLRVDPDTGYRFYTMDQLPQLYRILALKELGLGLTQIVAILDEGITAQALQGMLRLRQAQLQQHIATEHEHLTRIEARLRALEDGDCLPMYEVILKPIPAIAGVAMHLTTADLAEYNHWGDIVDASLKHYNITPTDHLILLQPAEHEQDPPPMAVEIVIPLVPKDVDRLVTESAGRFTRCDLTGSSHVASTLHQGRPGLVMPAYQALGIWMEHNGYTIVGPRRKVFLRRGEPLDDALTEIQFPVEKAAEPTDI